MFGPLFSHSQIQCWEEKLIYFHYVKIESESDLTDEGEIHLKFKKLQSIAVLPYQFSVFCFHEIISLHKATRLVDTNIVKIM